jgi:hypothetical protein
VADGSERETDVSIDADAGADADSEAVVVAMLDRLVAAGASRETFDAALPAGRNAVVCGRITDPATPAPPPTAVAIMLDAD